MIPRPAQSAACLDLASVFASATLIRDNPGVQTHCGNLPHVPMRFDAHGNCFLNGFVTKTAILMHTGSAFSIDCH